MQVVAVEVQKQAGELVVMVAAAMVEKYLLHLPEDKVGRRILEEAPEVATPMLLQMVDPES